MLVKLFLLTLLLCLSKSIEDIDQLLSEIFDTENSTKSLTSTTELTTQSWDIASDCVPYYLLNDSSTVDNTDTAPTAPTDDRCGKGYDCVPYFLCSKDNKIIEDGSGLLDISGPRKRSVDENTTTYKKCSYLELCCATPVLNTSPKPPKECGIRNIDGVGFKITANFSEESDYGEFPWMIAVLEKMKNNKMYLCGGSLITSSVVLTSADCVAKKDANTIKVRAGEWDTQTEKELYKHQDRDLVDIVIHENFYESGLFNDIALLFVSTPFEFEDTIQPICLPPPNTNFDYLRCFATGWGKDTSGKAGMYQAILKKIDLPIVPYRQCETELRKTRLGQYFKLDESFICAGGEVGKGTCQGDGGSPLVCPIPNTVDRYYQAGIVAWRIGCGDKSPDVFASVSFLRPWIDGVLAKKNISNTQFTYKE